MLIARDILMKTVFCSSLCMQYGSNVDLRSPNNTTFQTSVVTVLLLFNILARVTFKLKMFHSYFVFPVIWQ